MATLLAYRLVPCIVRPGRLPARRFSSRKGVVDNMLCLAGLLFGFRRRLWSDFAQSVTKAGQLAQPDSFDHLSLVGEQ